MRAVTLAMSAVLACSACGSEPAGSASPVSPTVVTSPDPLNRYVGTWSGDIRADACFGGRECLNAVGVTSRFELRIARAGAGLIGLWMPSADLIGTLDADDRVTFTGGAAHVSIELGDSEVEALTLVLTDSDELEGTASFSTRPPAGSERGSTYRKATFSHGRRLPEAVVEPYTGTWTGWFQEVYVNRPYFIDPLRELSLSLVQEGASVSGTMTMTFMGDIPVAGRVSGDGVTLTGEVMRNGLLARLVDFTIRRDVVGRLTGSYRLELPNAQPEFRLVRVVLGGSPR